MNASELFKAGQLQPAIDAQIQKVKANPGDQSARLFLFELLCFTGDLDRARRQVDALRYDEPEVQAAVLLYRQAIDAEEARRRVLAGRDRPKFLVAPPDHVEKRIEALAALGAGDRATYARLVEAANANQPLLRGHLNGRPFEGIRDGDDLFGTVLEVFGAGGNYAWVALEQVESLTMNAPATPRDLLCVACQLAVPDGPTGDVLLPALYDGSYDLENDQLRIGHDTQWRDVEGEPVRGQGGRMFLLGDGSQGVSLLEVRQLVIGEE